MRSSENIQRLQNGFTPLNIFATFSVHMLFIGVLLLPQACAPEKKPETGRLHAETRRVINIPLPRGYTRIKVKGGSFSEFLRKLPLKNPGAPVLYHDGTPKADQSLHHAVINIDTGKKNLQQCADAVMRLRAEYQFRNGLRKKIRFNLTSGHASTWNRWARGYRPVIRGRHVRFVLKKKRDYSYRNFRRYLEHIFTYAGTWSLSREMARVRSVKNITPGHVFIQGGSPGHAVLVVDVAAHHRSGKKIFLLAQSYMPAQSIHLLKNPVNRGLSPWYEADFGKKLITPEWIFTARDLKRF